MIRTAIGKLSLFRSGFYPAVAEQQRQPETLIEPASKKHHSSAPFQSKLFSGELVHGRSKPVKHAFSYPAFALGIELDELPLLSKALPLFSHNRFNIFSVHDHDYIFGETGAIFDRLGTMLQKRGFKRRIVRAQLTTMPRVFGYAFNPVSFYRCYGEGGSLVYFVAEVNNTFGESHLYVLDTPLADSKAEELHYRCPKTFHVSPFNNVSGIYDFRVAVDPSSMDFHVNLENNDGTFFVSRLYGKSTPLRSASLFKALTQYPLTVALTMPRIVWHAASLRFIKKQKVYTKPIAASTDTIRRSGPGFLQRRCLDVLAKFLSRTKKGELRLVFPDRPEMRFGGTVPGAKATVLIRNYDAFVRTAIGSDIGFGEAYTAGDWDSDDLTQVMLFFVENADCLESRDLLSTKIGQLRDRLFHLRHANRRVQAKKNIQAHYDLSNEFYKLFLDETMTYSSAVFAAADEPLERAQLRKIDLLLEKAKLQASDHLLEIGCGWGSLALRAAQQTGCRVTAITLSEKQYELARSRVSAAGLSGQIDIRLIDYRDLTGSFDKIISVEMLEAVGSSYYPTFFKKCDQLLKPDGIAVLQVITIPDQRYEAYRRSCDWIQKYIFPGGETPALSVLLDVISEHSTFVLEHMENIGTHYARTLREWHQRFLENRNDVAELGFSEDFLRMWSYYFSYCEAAFAGRFLGTMQMVLSRTGNQRLDGCPGY